MHVGDSPVDAIGVSLANVGRVLPASDDRGRGWLSRLLCRGRRGNAPNGWATVRASNGGRAPVQNGS